MTRLAELTSRAVLEVAGADRVGFLNGLVSNDVAQAAPGHAVWAALLTPQGKYVADFFIFAEAERLLLDCASVQAEEIRRRLGRYRLRADVRLAPADLRVFAVWDGAPDRIEGLAAPDPRLAEAGWRVLAHRAGTFSADEASYDRHRLALGLPDGVRDLEPEKSVLLEAGFDELNGISWGKGCYMGQELTARTRYRGLIKRRLLPVHADADLPPPGTPVFHGEREVGQMRSSAGPQGLATVRLEALGLDGLHCGGVPVTIDVKNWMRLPEPA